MKPGTVLQRQLFQKGERISLTGNRSRRSEYLVLLSLFMWAFEGSIRKWVLPAESGLLRYVVYLSKDFVLIALAFSSLRATPGAILNSYLRTIFVGIMIIVLGATISALHEVSIAGAFLTLRATVVLPLLAYACALRLKKLEPDRLAKWVAYFAILNAVLGVVQFFSPPDSTINRYSNEDAEITTFRNNVRAAGTFSYISGMAIMSNVAAWAGLMLLSKAGTSSKERRWGAVVLVSGFVCGAASVSRAAFLIPAAMLVGWFLLARRQASALINIFLVVGGLALAIYLVPESQEDSARIVKATFERHEAASDTVAERTFGDVIKIMEAIELAPLGAGLGLEQVGGVYFTTGKMDFRVFESQWARIVMDTGLLGLLGFLIVVLGLLKSIWKPIHQAQNSEVRGYLVATFLFILFTMYTNVIYNHVASSACFLVSAAMLAYADNLTFAITKTDSTNASA